MSVLTDTTTDHRPGALFHKSGLVYFWFLNDQCDMEQMRDHARAYAQAGIAAVCLHARPGLLFPYGGTAWFEMVKQITLYCIELGLEVWLYDEDPYPSGNAGGRIVIDHPELRGYAIEMDEADLTTCSDGLFGFKPGKLLWCGVIDADRNVVLDLTADVGLVRRQWTVLNPWDSRWYYPLTPLYSSPRARTLELELAVKLPALKEGQRLVAFTARPAGASSPWGHLVDTLNPKATQKFIQYTHERYLATLGEHFGKGITAIFTDEPKFHAQKPWTDDLAADFEKQFGYDIQSRLIHLFENSADDQANLTRLHYRQWCGQRFIDAWMKPIAKWCQEHQLQFVGHISPEDDPVEQSSSVTNLFPLQHHFDLTGLDVIIPAVGDKRHAILNLGVLTGVSVQQQQGKAGVLSELLGVSGNEMTIQTAARIVNWQTMMGVTTPVIHGGHNSVEGNRYIDAPPDSGPASAIWPDMVRLNQSVAAIQEVIRGSKNIAPTPILYPIRSFNTLVPKWQHEPGGLRGDLIDLVTECLDHQAGIHLLDEADLWQGSIEHGQLRIGHARYEHLLIPSCWVLHEKTLQKLQACVKAGICVVATGQLPTQVQSDAGLSPAKMDWCQTQTISEAVVSLPRLIELAGDAMDIRCTGWKRDGVVTRLLMNLRSEPYTFEYQGQTLTIQPDEVKILR